MDLIGALSGAAGAAGEAGNPNAWDVSKAYYDAGADAWDIAKSSSGNNVLNVDAEDLTPTGVFFKPDGTKVYVTGGSGQDVNEYSLSTPWLVSSASYVQNFSVTGELVYPQNLFFKSDGTKMYVISSNPDEIAEYDLSTAWDISSASHVQNLSVASQDTTPTGLFFKSDGTKMYISGDSNNSIFEYSLSSAWDISSASYVQSFSVASQDSGPQALFFKDDGTKMYVLGSTNQSVFEYDLSTAWDISSASYNSVSFNFAVASANGLFFKPDGNIFYVLNANNDQLVTYRIGGFSVAAKETNPFGVFFKPDGTIMYITGSDSDAIHSYTLSTAWDITTASFTDTFSVSATSLTPQDLFFKDDGTKMYLVDSNSDDVQEFSLSVAWDISTLSYVQNFSIAAVEGISSGIFFKSDGTKMYVVGSGADTVHEYALSTAWDISSASYTQGFSVAAQETAPQAISFKTDGTEMYILGSSGDDVNQYSLSTPWDISTASYLQSFYVYNSLPRGLYFRDDGMKFFITGSTLDKVFSFSILEE